MIRPSRSIRSMLSLILLVGFSVPGEAQQFTGTKRDDKGNVIEETLFEGLTRGAQDGLWNRLSSRE